VWVTLTIETYLVVAQSNTIESVVYGDLATLVVKLAKSL